MTLQSLNVQVHNVKVRNVHDLKTQGLEGFYIDFADPKGREGGNTVTFFTDDEQWDDIVATVGLARIAHRVKAEAEHYESLAGTDDGPQKCDECEMATRNLVSAEHAKTCSLHPDNCNV